MSVNSLPKTVTRQRRDCDLNPGPTAPESSTLTTRLPSYPNVNVASDKNELGTKQSIVNKLPRAKSRLTRRLGWDSFALPTSSWWLRHAQHRVDHGSGPSAGRVWSDRVWSGHQNREYQRVGSGRVNNFVYTTGRIGSSTQRVGSGPEKSDPWSTLVQHRVYATCISVYWRLVYIA